MSLAFSIDKSFPFVWLEYTCFTQLLRRYECYSSFIFLSFFFLFSSFLILHLQNANGCLFFPVIFGVSSSLTCPHVLVPERFWKEKIFPLNFVVLSEFPEKIQEYFSDSSLRGEGQVSALLYSSAEEIADFNNIYNAYGTSCLQSAWYWDQFSCRLQEEKRFFYARLKIGNFNIGHIRYCFQLAKSSHFL